MDGRDTNEVERDEGHYELLAKLADACRASAAESPRCQAAALEGGAEMFELLLADASEEVACEALRRGHKRRKRLEADRLMFRELAKGIHHGR